MELSLCLLLGFFHFLGGVPEARIDLNKSVIDKEVVEKVSFILDCSDMISWIACSVCTSVCLLKLDGILQFYTSDQVWDRIAPGLASQFDSPYTVPAIAPRPLLILNGKILVCTSTVDNHIQIIMQYNTFLNLNEYNP